MEIPSPRYARDGMVLLVSFPLFRGITIPVLPYLPPVPRVGAQAIAHPQIAACRPYLGLRKYHPSGVNVLSETSRNTMRFRSLAALQRTA